MTIYTSKHDLKMTNFLIPIKFMMCKKWWHKNIKKWPKIGVKKGSKSDKKHLILIFPIQNVKKGVKKWSKNADMAKSAIFRHPMTQFKGRDFTRILRCWHFRDFVQKSVVTFWSFWLPAWYREKSLCIYSNSVGLG